ncbi:MAG: type IV pilus biogenesis protein PilM [Polyangiales bacterium]
MARILGIDVDALGVRACMLRTSLRRTDFMAYEDIRLDTGQDEGLSQVAEERTDTVPQAQVTAVQDDDGAPRDSSPPRLTPAQDAVRRALETLMARLPQTPDRVVLHLPGDALCLHTVALPAAVARKVAEVLPFELESKLPFPLEESLIDHQVQGRVGASLQVLAAAARKDDIRACLAPAFAAGVPVRDLAAGALALEALSALLPELRQQAAQLIVFFGPSSIDLCVLQEGRTRFARSVTPGLAAPAKAVETALRHALIAYTASDHPPIARCLLAGDVDQLSEPVLWWRSLIDVETQLLALPQVAGGEMHTPAAFARAAALAARGLQQGRRINLMQGELAPAQRRKGMGPQLRQLSWAATFIVLCFAFSLYARWSVLTREHEALTAELGQRSWEVLGERMDSAEAVRALLDKGQAGMGPLPQFDVLDAIDALSARIAPEITHDTRRLNIDISDGVEAGSLQIEGQVASVKQRDDIAAALDKFRCFQEVEKGATEKLPSGETLSYRLEAQVRCRASKTKQDPKEVP